MKLRLIVLCAGALTTSTWLSAQQVKRIIAWEKTTGQQDSSLVVQKQFSQEGYVLQDAEPAYYCGTSSKYDQQGRVIEREQYCGETIENGTSTFSYEGNRVCEVFEGGYNCIRCNDYDDKGNLLMSERTDITYDYGTDPYTKKELSKSIASYTYSFSQAGLPVRVTMVLRETYFESDDSGQDAQVTVGLSSTVTEFTYNERDSVTSRMVRNLLPHRDTAQKTIYIYNEQGYMVEELEFDHQQVRSSLPGTIIGPDQYRIPNSRQLIRYDNQNQVVEKLHYYNPVRFGKPRTREMEQLLSRDVFREGKLIRTEYPAGPTVVDYHYEYWD